jgi:hypothetical protein
MTNDKPELPELSQAVLDDSTLQALVQDLSALTRILSVTTKGAAQTRAQAAPCSLQEAVEALRHREVRGVQVHYLWENQEWIDTLLAVPEGIRIVRTAAP